MAGFYAILALTGGITTAAATMHGGVVQAGLGVLMAANLLPMLAALAVASVGKRVPAQRR